MTNFDVNGKVAIITGAGSGINFSFAALLLSKGCNIVIADLTLLPAAEALIKAHASSTPRALFQATDVTDWTQLSRLFTLAEAEFGDLHLVCPGAGIFEPPFSNFWLPPGSTSSKDVISGLGHYATLDINITHPIRMTQLAISHFLNPPSGDTSKAASLTNPKRILHIASTASEIATLPYPMYVASKWAISGFVRSLASLEEEVGIRVNAVAPGMVQTPLWTEHEISKLSRQKRDSEVIAKEVVAEEIKLEEEQQQKQQPVWITPHTVAEVMLDLIQDPTMVGGTVLEVTTLGTREIPLYGNTGPPTLGGARAKPVYGDVYERLAEKGWGRVAMEAGEPEEDEQSDR